MAKKVAIVGIQGLPANYGGFETMVENIIGENCSEGIEYTVFGSSKDMVKTRDLKEYKGAKLRYVDSFKANGAQSTPYDIVSLLKCVGKGYDVVLVLGVSGCIFLPIFRLLYRGKLIVNIDGLEHRRAKWGKFAKWFLRFSEKCAVKMADVIVSDNVGIQNYVTETYHKHSEMIAYGGDQALRVVNPEREKEILAKFGLEKGRYAFTVCRIEPENNCHVTLEAFAKMPEGANLKKLMFVGNWSRSDYGMQLMAKYEAFSNIMIQTPIYDLDTLYVLRSCAGMYVHGHSAGGTNPSLVEAMQFPVPIVAFDCIYNRETTHGKALYFADADELLSKLTDEGNHSAVGQAMQEIAKKEYQWKIIAEKYEALY